MEFFLSTLTSEYIKNQIASIVFFFGGLLLHRISFKNKKTQLYEIDTSI